MMYYYSRKDQKNLFSFFHFIHFKIFFLKFLIFSQFLSSRIFPFPCANLRSTHVVSKLARMRMDFLSIFLSQYFPHSYLYLSLRSSFQILLKVNDFPPKNSLFSLLPDLYWIDSKHFIVIKFIMTYKLILIKIICIILYYSQSSEILDNIVIN